MDKTTCTTETLSTSTVNGTTLTAAALTEHNGFESKPLGTYYVATQGEHSSGYCTLATEALERAIGLARGDKDITEAPKGIANTAQMAHAVAKFDGGLSFRDGGVCEHAVRTGYATGILSPEWVVASKYVVKNRLWK